MRSRKKHAIMRLRGIGKYCHLNEPNKKFDSEFGEYSCDLVIPSDTIELLQQSIAPIYEEELSDLQKELDGKTIKKADMPFVDQDDGTHLVKIKLKAGGRRADGTVYKLGVALFDSANNPLPKDIKVWGGSEVNVAFRPVFYHSPLLGFGVRFELHAVQIIKLSEGGVSAMAATAFGFTEDEGFVVNGGENLDSTFDAEDHEASQKADF